MGRSQQAKGKRGELELAAILDGYGYNMKRGTSQNYGTEPDLTGLPGIHVECKRQERLNLAAAMEQADRDSKRFGGLPAVFHRANRSRWQVTMYLDDWMRIYATFRHF
jgi:Holliday junction resolvase